MTQFYREIKKNLYSLTMIRKNHFATVIASTKYQNRSINNKFITSFHQKPEIFYSDPNKLPP
jgi:hypothetical protein